MSLKEEEGREDIHGGSGTQIFVDPNDQVGQYFPASSDVKKSPPGSNRNYIHVEQTWWLKEVRFYFCQ